MKKELGAACLALLALAAASGCEDRTVHGHDWAIGVHADPHDTAADEQAVANLLEGLPEAWNARDAAAWAGIFAEESSFTNILGMRFDDRTANEARHAHLFETIFAASHLASEVSSVRVFAGDAAVAELELTLRGYEQLPPGVEESEPGLLRTRLVTVLDKRHGRWIVVAAQNTAILPAALAAPDA